LTNSFVIMAYAMLVAIGLVYLIVVILVRTLVRTLTLYDVGGMPQAVAVDARSGHAFVTTGSGVTMLDARRGTILRRIPIPGLPQDIAVDERIGRAFLTVEKKWWPRTIPGAVRILDTQTGATLRAIPVANPVDIAVDGQVGHLVICDVGGSTNHVLLLDARTGALRARFPLSPGNLSFTVDERASRTYVVDEDAGSVMVLDDRTGAVPATVHVHGRPALSPASLDYSASPVVVDDRFGHAFVASDDGHNVTMLDSHTGRLIRTIALAQDAELTDIAVDHHSVAAWSSVPFSRWRVSARGRPSVE
jgi:DNA-binding beta-propeller fold protein YncE